MVKICIPILIQDPDFWEAAGISSSKLPPVDGAELERPFFEDGPRTDLLEVSDPIIAIYKKGKGKIGGFLSESGQDIMKEFRALIKVDDRKKIIDLLYSPTFIVVSTFACALRTLALFERKNILGRPLQWVFSPARLICEPRCNEAIRDARYHRETKRIYFGPSAEVKPDVRNIYLSLSRESVAHETAHAILDGINPYLYDSFDPHARALHESLADLSALLVAIKSSTLIEYVMGLSSGSLDGENAFSDFAENIGAILNGGKKGALRSFMNDEKLEDPVMSVYGASTVLSGAIWDLLRKLHAPYRDELARTTYKDKPNPQYSASGEPLTNVTRRLRLILYRALDYLPGGNITLSDYGRALLLADMINFGPGTHVAESLKNLFLLRGIFKSNHSSHVDFDPVDSPLLPAGGWASLAQDHTCLEKFVEDSRPWLGIPKEVTLDQIKTELWQVLPPQPETDFIEVVNFRKDPIGIVRILWNEIVANRRGGKLAKFATKRAKLVGTTVIIDCVGTRILARLSNATPTAGLYSDPALRLDRKIEIKAHDQETNLYLEKCNLKIEKQGRKRKMLSGTAQVVANVIVFSGHGLSLHEKEFPVISVTKM
jgi:hypothetical protein